MSSFPTVHRARRAGKITLFFLWSAFAAIAYNIYSEAQELALIDHLEELDNAAYAAEEAGEEFDGTYSEATLARIDANEDRKQFAAFGYLAVLVICTIFLLVWVSRVNRACRELGATDLRFTPGWAWGYWLVPIVNLWRPFQIVRELWVTTDPGDDSSPLVGWWWAAWIISGFFDRFGARDLGDDSTLEQFREADHLLLVSNGLELISFALTIAVVTKLTAKLVAYQDRVTPAAVRVVTDAPVK